MSDDHKKLGSLGLPESLLWGACIFALGLLMTSGAPLPCLPTEYHLLRFLLVSTLFNGKPAQTLPSLPQLAPRDKVTLVVRSGDLARGSVSRAWLLLRHRDEPADLDQGLPGEFV